MHEDFKPKILIALVSLTFVQYCDIQTKSSVDLVIARYAFACLAGSLFAELNAARYIEPKGALAGLSAHRTEHRATKCGSPGCVTRYTNRPKARKGAQCYALRVLGLEFTVLHTVQGSSHGSLHLYMQPRDLRGRVRPVYYPTS